MWTVFLSATAALLLSAILTRLFCRPESRFYLLDHPNERSLHALPTPRSGGIAITIALAASLLVSAPLSRYGLLHALAIALLACLSYIDDRRGLSVGIRLFGHFIVATLVVGGVAFPHPVMIWPDLSMSGPAWLQWTCFVVFLVGMINVYNFMDGMDGFAGGMALIGFGTLAALGMKAGHIPFAMVSAATAASAAGFLISNFPPARIFMGDTGSSVLGFLAGMLILWGSREGIFPLWVGLLVFSPFWVDSSVTLVRRFLAGERVWQAHKTHYYQRLVQCGWGHRRTVVVEYSLMLATAGSSLIATNLQASLQVILVIAWILIYILLMVSVDRYTNTRTTP